MQENLEEIRTEDGRTKVCLGLSHLTSNYWEHPLPRGSKATCHPRGPGTLPSSFFPGIRASTIRMVQRCGQAGKGDPAVGSNLYPQ